MCWIYTLLLYIIFYCFSNEAIFFMECDEHLFLLMTHQKKIGETAFNTKPFQITWIYIKSVDADSPNWWWCPSRLAPDDGGPSSPSAPAPSWSSPSPDRSTAPQRWSEPAARSPPWSNWLPAGLSGNPCGGKRGRHCYHRIIYTLNLINLWTTKATTIGSVSEVKLPTVWRYINIWETFLSMHNF